METLKPIRGPKDSFEKSNAESPSRRKFISGLGCAAAASLVAGATAVSTESKSTVRQNDRPAASDWPGNQRALQSFQNRQNAAIAELRVPIPPEVTNGDEQRYPNFIGNYSKGLMHNNIGEVEQASYQSMLNAVQNGIPQLFEQIQIGGNTPLVDPQAGLAFDLEGTDSHQLAIGTPPPVASQQLADTAVENYWMALCRDVNFTQYGNEPISQAAIAELNSLSAFTGLRPVTPQNLFRGFTSGDVLGPYMSQFILQPLTYGAIPITQMMTTYVPGVDYMTDQSSWLAVQNGQGPFGSDQPEPNLQHIRNGRGIGAYVHVDVLFEAYFNACLKLIDAGAPLDPNNPYVNSRTQTGFGTFGNPHLKTLVAEVSQRALKAVWFVKWFVHRHLRPEEFGGLVHMTKTRQANYPLHPDILNSHALAEVFAKNGTYFLPHAFPEGCPQHPSYGQGHGTVAGACATIVKAWFNDLTPLTSIPGFTIVQPSEDGLSLVPYEGSDADRLTIGGEMNKLAANIAIGRNHAAVHWRHDYMDSLPFGEAVAISMLSDMAHNWNENFEGFSFTKFNGTRVSGIGGNKDSSNELAATQSETVQGAPGVYQPLPDPRTRPETTSIVTSPDPPPTISPSSGTPLEGSGFGLQVAAMTKEDNADALVSSLHERNVPVRVLKRASDRFYRVVVGPYGDKRLANHAKSELETWGFKSILVVWKP
ncbi:MAG: SPOR domain-containing protein [Candidatus Acidiferrales bacterium]